MGPTPGDAQGSRALRRGSEPGSDSPRDRGEPGSARQDRGHQQLRDEVDELVVRWRAERPDLDVEPLQVLSRVSRLARHLDRARTTAFAAHGPQAWEVDVLSALPRLLRPPQGPPPHHFIVVAPVRACARPSSRASTASGRPYTRPYPQPQEVRCAASSPSSRWPPQPRSRWLRGAPQARRPATPAPGSATTSPSLTGCTRVSTPTRRQPPSPPRRGTPTSFTQGCGAATPARGWARSAGRARPPTR